MEKELKDEIFTCAEQHFAFLKTEKGFTQPEVVQKPYSTSLIYRNATMEIHIEMLLGATGMHIMIAKLGSDGKRAIDPNRHNRQMLEILLTQVLHVQDKHVQALDAIRHNLYKDLDWSKKSQWMQVIGLYQAVLRDHIDLLLQQPPDVLYPNILENSREKELKDEIFTCAEQHFAFLKTEKGFTQLEVDQEPGPTLLVYRNATMEIRLEMHLWAAGMKIMIEKLESDGDEHRRTLWLLESLLTRLLHVRDEHIQALDAIRLDLYKDHDWSNKMWEKSQWMQVIGLYQVLLRDHIDLLLQQPLDVLFPTGTPYVGSVKEWEDLTDDIFGFLEEYGFGPHPVHSSYAWLSFYTWMSADRGIRLTVDIRDTGLFCDMLELIEGKIPTLDKTLMSKDAHFILGKGATGSLVGLLTERLGITDPDIEHIINIDRILNIRDASDCDHGYYSTCAIAHANLVRRYIKVLMQAPLETLFGSVR